MGPWDGFIRDWGEEVLGETSVSPVDLLLLQLTDQDYKSLTLIVSRGCSNVEVGSMKCSRGQS